MNAAEPQIYEFDDFRLDAGRRLLLQRGEPVPLKPKVFDTLLYLARHQGRILEKDELMRAIWPDAIVEENNLNQNVSTLRRALGESLGENRYIVTVPGRGYRFAATVTAIPNKTAGRQSSQIFALEPVREKVAEAAIGRTLPASQVRQIAVDGGRGLVRHLCDLVVGRLAGAAAGSRKADGIAGPRRRE